MIDVGLLVGFAGIFVATLAGVLGVWMERDRSNPPWFALFFSLLIVFASFIEVGRTVVAAWQDSLAEDTMARVLEELAALSERSDDPELAALVGAELSRANPRILKRVEKKVAAKGGDPTAIRKKVVEGRRPASARKTPGEGRKSPASTAKEAKAGAEGAAEGVEEGKEGKAGKAGKAEDPATGAVEGAADAAAGKAGKAVEDAASKAAGDAAAKAGKAVGDAVGGKAGKAATEATEKAGKAVGDALKDTKLKAPF